MKLQAPAITVLGTVENDLIERFVSAIGDGSTWPDNGRAAAYLAQRNTWSLAFRENPVAVDTRYQKDSFDADQVLVDTPARRNHPEIEPLLDIVMNLKIGTEFGKILAVWLRARASIGVHVDEGRYYEVYNRIHIPLVTDPGVRFISDTETFHMERGKIYLLQNLKPHGVLNRAQVDRLHLVLDIR